MLPLRTARELDCSNFAIVCDRLQLKANGRSVEGARLHNGELVTVARVDPTGALVVSDERGATKTLAPSQRLFVRGYAVTSYGSQGKTVDTVLLADSGNRTATNAQQWYVGISRGRKRVVVFTPDKTELRANIQRSGDRELALQAGLASNAKQRVPGPERTERIRESIELARWHQFIPQQINRTQQVQQRI